MAWESVVAVAGSVVRGALLRRRHRITSSERPRLWSKAEGEGAAADQDFRVDPGQEVVPLARCPLCLLPSSSPLSSLSPSLLALSLSLSWPGLTPFQPKPDAIVPPPTPTPTLSPLPLAPPSPAMPVEGVTQFRGLSVQDAIDDLAARFIVNIPAAELEDMVRVCFQIELAYVSHPLPCSLEVRARVGARAAQRERHRKPRRTIRRGPVATALSNPGSFAPRSEEVKPCLVNVRQCWPRSRRVVPARRSRRLPPRRRCPLDSPQGALCPFHQLGPIPSHRAASSSASLPAPPENSELTNSSTPRRHWYYEDFVRPTASNPALFPTYNLKQFYILMLRSCELLRDVRAVPRPPLDPCPAADPQPLLPPQLLEHAEQIWTSFMAYKVRVPVCGAILISQDWNKVRCCGGRSQGGQGRGALTSGFLSFVVQRSFSSKAGKRVRRGLFRAARSTRTSRKALAPYARCVPSPSSLPTVLLADEFFFRTPIGIRGDWIQYRTRLPSRTTRAGLQGSRRSRTRAVLHRGRHQGAEDPALLYRRHPRGHVLCDPDSQRDFGARPFGARRRRTWELIECPASRRSTGLRFRISRHGASRRRRRRAPLLTAGSPSSTW